MRSGRPNGTTKTDLRRRILAERRRRSSEVREAASRALAGHLMRKLAVTSTGDLAAFLPLDTEPPLLAALEAAGLKVTPLRTESRNELAPLICEHAAAVDCVVAAGGEPEWAVAGPAPGG